MATASRPTIESRHFFETLSRRHRGVLVIDFDSTIAQLGRADAVFPYPTVQELLDCIASVTGTRVIVATRRPAAELRAYFTAPGPEICTSADAALDKLSAGAPLAYVTGEPSDAKLAMARRLRVCPEFHLGRSKAVAAPAEDLVQFLMEWLRACTEEVC
jgi:hypothetical protein